MFSVSLEEEREEEMKDLEHWSWTTGKRAKGILGVLHGIVRSYDRGTVVTLGYCPSTAFSTVVSEATLLNYGLLLDVILFDKSRTQISAFWGELVLNCCKPIQIQRQNKQVNIYFFFPHHESFLLSCILATLLSSLII